MASVVTTTETIGMMMMDYFRRNPNAWGQYNKTIRDKGFSYGVPKERLLITIDPSASIFDMEILSMGLM